MPDVSPQNGNGNQRVTLAEIRKDIQYLIEEVKDMRVEDQAYRMKQEMRVAELEKGCLTMHSDLARLDERQKATTGVLGVLSLVAATVAGAVGSLVK